MDTLDIILMVVFVVIPIVATMWKGFGKVANVVAEAADVVRVMMRATSPQSPGGTSFTDDEKAAIRKEIDDLRRAIKELQGKQ